MDTFPSPIVPFIANGIVFAINILLLGIWCYATYRKPSFAGFWFNLIALPLYVLINGLFLLSYLHPDVLFRYLSPRLFFTSYTIGIVLMPVGSLLNLISCVLVIRQILKPTAPA